MSDDRVGEDKDEMAAPMNAVGEAPSHGASEVAARLLEKMRGLHGAANRARARAEAQRVLAAGHPAV